MVKLLLLCALLAPGMALAQSEVQPMEQAVPDYVVSDKNAGATPYFNDKPFRAFGELEAIERVVANASERVFSDPVIGDIFFATDHVRFRRTLTEQFCYLLGGPCRYTGRDMKSIHKDHGLTLGEFNRVVVAFQEAMSDEGIPFSAQNKLLAKLAPMSRDIVTR